MSDSPSPNLVDRVINYWSPLRGMRRAAARSAGSQFSGYAGAQTSRYRHGWDPGQLDADSDLLLDLPELRGRCRELWRDNPVAKGIVDTFVVQEVGDGINPEPSLDAKALDMDEETAEKIRKEQEIVWREWSAEADITGVNDFVAIEQLQVGSRVMNGEGLVLVRRDAPGDRYLETALELIEPDRLGDPNAVPEEFMRSGVELGPNGDPVRYHIQKAHPGATYSTASGSDFEPVSKYNEDGRRQVFHLFIQKRVGQNRGIPELHACINALKDFDDYLRAEIVAARISACIGLIVTKSDPYAYASSMAEDTDTDGNYLEHLRPGMIHYGSPGEEVSPFNPQRPGVTFEPFVNRLQKMLASAVNLPYEVVSKDYSESNYSNMRAALLDARRHFECGQRWLIASFCQPIWRIVMEEAYLKERWGKNTIRPAQLRDNLHALTTSKWVPRGWAWVDPQKESTADIAALGANLTTLERVCQTRYGTNWRETLAQRSIEKELEKELGVDAAPDMEVPNNGEEGREADESDDRETPGDPGEETDARSEAEARGVSPRSGNGLARVNGSA